MKKFVITLFAMALFGWSDAQLKTPQASVSADIEQTVGITKIEIEYSRPNKDGRELFGDLVPYGKVWRTGANKNTTIEFSDDVTIDGQTLRAGEYAIYTKPGKDSWEIYFYSDNENWGNPQVWDDSKVMARTTAKVQKLNQNVESFTISLDDLTFDSAILNFAWGNVKVGTKIEVPTDKKVMASIEQTLNATPKAQDYLAAANYYYSTRKDIQQAKKWMDEGMKANPNPPFYLIHQQALIHAKAGDKKSALKLAQSSLDASKAAGNTDYVKKNEDLIKSLK